MSSIILNEKKTKASNEKSIENKDKLDIEKSYNQPDKEYQTVIKPSSSLDIHNINNDSDSKLDLNQNKNESYHNKQSDEKESSFDDKNIKVMVKNDINEESLSLKHQLSLFWSILKTDKIYKPVIFIFMFMITPSYGDSMFYFYTNVLKFNPITIGRLRLVYGIATILGIYLYNNFLRETSFKKIIIVSTILSSFFNMMSLALVERINLRWGIPDYMFCLASDALTTALSEINFLPILVLACNICPKNIEGTLYAFLMSIVNLSSLFSNQFGAGITYIMGITSSNFSNLKYLIILSNLSMLLPMAFLYLINEKDYIKKEDNKNTDNEENEELIQEKPALKRSNSFKDENPHDKDNINHSKNYDKLVKKQTVSVYLTEK